MKPKCSSLHGNLFVVALLPVLLGTGCNNQNQAAATLPPAGSSFYPSSVEHTPPAEGSIWSANETQPVQASPSKPALKPFSLRSGETLASYKVQKGDNLSKIASRYGTSVSRIQAANGLTSSKILAGKSYKVPTKKSADEVASVNSSTSTTIKYKPSKPEPPTPPTYNSPPSSVISSSPAREQSYKPAATSDSYKSVSDAYKTYNSSQAGTYAPPPTTTRPVFTPRNFDGPQISSPSNSITIPTEEASGSGSAFPSPTFGSGSF